MRLIELHNRQLLLPSNSEIKEDTYRYDKRPVGEIQVNSDSSFQSPFLFLRVNQVKIVQLFNVLV